MEPRIEYATTADGVSIACWALGKGPPLLSHPPTPGHAQAEWRSRVVGDVYRSLVDRYRLIRFDSRDSGLSQRTGAGFSFETNMLDTDAVIEHFSAAPLSFFASGPAGVLAIDYAARRPEYVKALILNESFPSFAAIADGSRVRALRALLESDYELYTETMGSVFWGFSSNEPAREYAALMRQSQTAEEARRFIVGFAEVDVSSRLPLIRCPTLVLHHRGATLVPMDAITSLAARIPSARLAIIEGDTVAGSSNSVEEAAAIDRFLLGEDAPPRAVPAAPDRPPGTAVILFVDIADSTRLTEDMGDAAFRAKARDVDLAVRRAVRESGGTPVEGRVLGDGVMAIFPAAAPAVECALRCADEARAAGLPLHLGIHAGDVIKEGDDVYGGAVNTAARIAGMAAPGDVLVSDVVRALARTSANVAFEDRGEAALKGIADPVRVWSVRRRP